MKIRNKTGSTKQLINRENGKLIEVEAGKIIELKKASFNPNAFEIVKYRQKKHKNKKCKTEKNEKKIIEKEVI